MSEIAIRVENLGKQYRIGGPQARYKTIRESLVEAVQVPWRGVGNLLRGHKQGADTDTTIWALKDVSFEIESGEAVGIIGRNGAGKSTLLKILSRITKPTEGYAKIHGRIGSLLEVGTGFHPELTGRENIYLNGAILGMKKREIDCKFDEIVAFAEIEKFMDTPVKHYSSGMYVRLAFAVAAHLEPEILLVDEVLAVGDAEFQKKCLGKMGDVAQGGRTVLFVSHNMTALQSLCQRAIWLREGRNAGDGPVGKIVPAYLQSAAGQVLEQTWSDPQTAPGGPQGYLYRVNISPDGHLTDAITVRTPIRIEFEYQNWAPDVLLNFSLVLYTLEEVCVLNSVSSPARFPVGAVRGVCHIPANLLNDGTFRVRVLVVRDTAIPLLDCANAGMFQVYDVGREWNWYGKWVGVVRPDLEWTLESDLSRHPIA
jgi:lipopolysaccharide transport system ATP-binding protein